MKSKHNEAEDTELEGEEYVDLDIEDEHFVLACVFVGNYGLRSGTFSKAKQF
jgi:hypothetical protein